MPEKVNQQQNNQQNMTADETKALLGLATRLSEGLMPKAPPESPQTQEMGATSDETPEMGEDTMKQDQEAKMAEMEDFKKEVKEMIKEEMSGIKETIEKALKDKNE